MTGLFSATNSGVVGGLSLVVSVVGLILTLLGLWLTYRQAEAAATSADASIRAVEDFKFRLGQYNAARDLTEALYAIDSTRSHLNNEMWKDASISYEDARRALIRLSGVEEIRPLVNDRFETILSNMGGLCDQINAAVSGKAKLPNKSKSLTVMRENYDYILTIRTALERSV